MFTDGAYEEEKGFSGAVIAHSSRGTHASGFHVDDAPIQLARHHGKRQQTGLLDFLPVIVLKCSVGARHRLINVYAADKCAHNARSATHMCADAPPRVSGAFFVCPSCLLASLVRVFPTVRCWGAFFSFSRAAAFLCCFPWHGSRACTTLVEGRQEVNVLHGHRLRSVGAIEGVYGCPVLDTSRTTGDEVLACVFRRLVLFVILSCVLVLGI